MPLSYSQLSTYSRCPKQYEYASIKKLPRAISRGESFGSSIHNALRKFGMLEQEYTPQDTKKQLQLFTGERTHHAKPELSLHTLLGYWRESFIAEGYDNRAAISAAIASGEAALRHYFHWWEAQPRTVAAIEKSFSFIVPETENLKLAGRFDRVERTPEGLSIIDYKSSGPRPEDSLKTDLQLSVYAYAAAELWQEPVTSLCILSITDSGVTEQTTTRSQSELQDAMTNIRLLHERMANQDYAATPSTNVCRHCPYREICPARKL